MGSCSQPLLNLALGQFVQRPSDRLLRPNGIAEQERPLGRRLLRLLPYPPNAKHPAPNAIMAPAASLAQLIRSFKNTRPMTIANRMATSRSAATARRRRRGQGEGQGAGRREQAHHHHRPQPIGVAVQDGVPACMHQGRAEHQRRDEAGQGAAPPCGVMTSRQARSSRKVAWAARWTSAAVTARRAGRAERIRSSRRGSLWARPSASSQ